MPEFKKTRGFRMKGYSAFDKGYNSPKKQTWDPMDHLMGPTTPTKPEEETTDNQGVFYQKDPVPIPTKPNPDSDLIINDANLQKLAKKYEMNVNTIKKIISSLDDEAGGDDDYSLPDVEDAIKTFVRTTSNADEVD